jgi:hypothetical protein
MQWRRCHVADCNLLFVFDVFASHEASVQDRKFVFWCKNRLLRGCSEMLTKVFHSARSSFMGVAQRVDVRVKVPFAARVRTRVALVQRRFVICATVALLAMSVASRMRDRAMF